MAKKHQYNMGLIGNCAYMAYIDDVANVKWLCWPRFDSSFVFGSMLDENKGGVFSIRPGEALFESFQYYIENTNILVTEFHTASGRFRVLDFAPRFSLYERFYKPLMFCRKVEIMEGSPLLRVRCKPVGDYGRAQPDIVQGSNHIRYAGISESQLRLTTNAPLTYIINSQDFVVSDTIYFAFTYGSPLEAPLPETVDNFYNKTKKYWEQWAKATAIGFFHQKAILRSALVLKLHQYEDTGGIIASGSMALPEFNGSGRNWDYRYCWMRDTFYTLNAFNNIGHFDELEEYFHYIRNIISSEKERAQPLYGITANKKITEVELDYLEGYMGNKPVRLGNAAYTHIQNDIYGQVLAALLPLYIDGRLLHKNTGKYTDIVYWLLGRIEQTMDEPDAGLWEFREQAQLHCYTFLFHWAGSKAASKIADFLQDDKMKALAEKLATMSSQKIELCYSEKKGAYAQAVGSDELDAACLQLITMGYLDPNAPQTHRHLEALENELRTDQGLFFRYKHIDDFGEPESTFLVCAFWYIEALAIVGRANEAIRYFENILHYSNNLGLFSEDVDARDGSQWGNFPQTYSHVGLMNAAFRIAKKLDRPLFL